ncbi:LysM peptidoglycan-binding domain-containing protein [[Clostridium] scindens]|uniref:LysM peptidoglycan-binding domain-containing protein n=1 Tax=Clostridium scindens (strain JCM 10418 / VPI 12708) TaxID=29347 RepID=UPI0015705C40|nr:LysM peptidoglycan-binding domain-containing protein [[Clostridium] scindens]NSI90033.1 LysM peptidoglycan-binding domain-containing protein [[Clostridium] scindens]NSJ04555.1 LysM peptidoglycan-binding domain-containing protein [[Clostridium] scindens]
MERQFPKNVRQIGNVSDEPKIYVEDYVDTYLNQLRERAAEEPVGVMLTGEILIQEGQAVVYASGAIRMKEIEVNGTEIVIGEDTFKELEEERKQYFPSSDAVGWCLIENGHPMGQNRQIAKIHEKSFAKSDTVFIWKDAVDNEEVYYAYKYGELMQMGGHYIYYEKNPNMQNYMISTRKKIGVTPSEVVEDRAAKDFRSVVRERMEDKEQRQSSRLVYVTSALLVVVVLAIGISTVNNITKMEAVQSSLESLSQSASKTESQTGTVNEGEDGALEANGIIGDGEAKDKEASGGTVPETSTVQEQLSDEDYYVVRKGDTLDSISVKVYGDASHVEALCKMNGLSDGNLIYIGQKLLLP